MLPLDALRIGHGFDVHALATGRDLILGGVKIPHVQGLDGHSDADVLLHALTDAILGAVAADDIGAWFPDTDEAHRGADSGVLLQTVWTHVQKLGWGLINLDAVVMAQEPKLRPHIVTIRQRIASLLEVDVTRVSVKATTTERLGFVGRKEGIAASATVLLGKVGL